LPNKQSHRNRGEAISTVWGWPDGGYSGQLEWDKGTTDGAKQFEGHIPAH